VSDGPDPPQIDVSLARRLIDSQFPQWSRLPSRDRFRAELGDAHDR
jgi:hypothetical protein